MLRLLLISSFIFSTLNVEAAIQWNRQKVYTNYKLNEDLILKNDSRAITLKKDSNLELIEVSELTMIKVYMHKYKVSPCRDKNFTTDLQLVDVKQSDQNSIVVGVNLTKKCQLEVFIDVNEYNLTSFVK